MLESTYFVMHLAGEVLELHPGVVQTLPLDVVVWGVGQELMQGDDIPRNLSETRNRQ